MALTNSQYDEIMRQYNRIQDKHQRTLEAHHAEIAAKIPRIPEIGREISSLSIRRAKELLTGAFSSWDYEQAKESLAEERSALLLAHGYPEDYLELQYDCPLCKDTGYRGGVKCECFKRAAITLLYNQSQLNSILETENFAFFNESLYDDGDIDPGTGKSSRELALFARDRALAFVRDFDKEHGNLIIYGNTGVGKTFLTHCIAKELMDRGHSCIYFSANELFEQLADRAFGNYGDDRGMPEFCEDCDLMIIDDLGTELTNAFVASRLFVLINKRISLGKSTIISTNLELEAISEMYSERIFSRILSSYTMVRMTGRDIRILKKISGGK